MPLPAIRDPSPCRDRPSSVSLFGLANCSYCGWLVPHKMCNQRSIVSLFSHDTPPPPADVQLQPHSPPSLSRRSSRRFSFGGRCYSRGEHAVINKSRVGRIHLRQQPKRNTSACSTSRLLTPNRMSFGTVVNATLKPQGSLLPPPAPAPGQFQDGVSPRPRPCQPPKDSNSGVRSWAPPSTIWPPPRPSPSTTPATISTPG